MTDLGSGALIELEVVNRNNDKALLSPDLRSAQKRLASVGEKLGGEELLSSTIRSVTAEAAYHDTQQLVSLEESLKTYVPNTEQRNRRPRGVSDEYHLVRFVYDAERDEMICPQGERLRRRKWNPQRTAITYEGNKLICDSCVAKSRCCPRGKSGRSVNRPIHGELLKRVEERVASPLGQWLSRARKVTMEGAFARLTELLNWRRCRCWGASGAAAEGLWRTICHNLMLLIGHWKPLVREGAPAG